MAITAKAYGKFALSLVSKKVDLTADTIKAMLCTSGYTPDQDTHQFKSDVTSEVANGNGYTTGGVTLTTVTVTYDASSNTLKFDADDPTWATATITARYCVFYDDTPATAATKPLICYVD